MSLPMPPSPAPTLPRCYRHPDRETGRSCTRCGKPACGDCLLPASVGSHCLDCTKAARPDVKTRARYWNAKQNILVTYAFMAASIAVFIYTSIADPDSLTRRQGLTQAQCDLGLNKVIMQEVIGCRAELYFPTEWHRLVTSGFLHYGVIHIALNMVMLYQLGNLIEPAVGRLRFALLYVASLFGGSLGILVSGSEGLAGGASGAVFGLLAASAIGLHRRGVSVFSTGIGTTLVLNLVLTFAIPGISIGGHLGGAAAGAACGFVMLAPKWRPVPAWATWATPIAVTVLAIVGSAIVIG